MTSLGLLHSHGEGQDPDLQPQSLGFQIATSQKGQPFDEKDLRRTISQTVDFGRSGTVAASGCNRSFFIERLLTVDV
jgi:hypothetical protein